MAVGSLAHPLLVDLGLSVSSVLLELLETVLVFEHWAGSVLLLDLELLDFLLDLLELALFSGELLFGLVVLFLNLRELDGNLIDFFLVVLES